MADKDVRLVIRAKNEASKEIKSIAQAMKDLDDQTDDAGSSVKKNVSVFGKLSDEIKKFNAQTAAFGAISRVAGIMDKAGASADKLKSEVADLKEALDKSKASTDGAARNTENLRANLDSLQKAFDEAKAKTDAARKAQDRNSDSTKQLSAAKKDLARANELSAKNPEKASRIDSATQSISAAQTIKDQNVAAYQALKAELSTFRDELKRADAALSESEKAFRQSADTTLRLEASLVQTTAEVARIDQAMAEMGAEARDAAAALGVAAGSEKAMLAATQGLAPQIERMGVALAALKRYSTGGDGFADPKTAAALRAQRDEIAKTADAQKELQSIAQGLAVEMKQTGDPTGQLAVQLKEVTGAAKAAKTEFNAQTAVLAKLQGSAQSTFAEFSKANGTLPSLSANYDKNTASAQRLADAIARYSTGSGSVASSDLAEKLRAQNVVVNEATARYQLLSQEVARLKAAMGNTSGTDKQAEQLRLVAQSANQAEKEVKDATAALRQMQSGIGNPFRSLNDGSRESLSLFQRLRGEVLSLTASFVGFFGAIEGIKGVLTSFQSVEAASNRLGAVFHQNSATVGNEIDWIRRQANRLGIEFGSLSGEYGKFSIAAQAANISSETTRSAFLSVAEAGRVNKLSMDDLNGVFLALTQSLSKGKFQAEEVRGQLGERLPGAFNILADAIGVSTGELDNMMKAGEVLANEDTLSKFANELNKRFGSQLQTSLAGTTKLLGDFANDTTQAQLQFANGGFIESFNKALGDLDQWFKSREGRDFFLSLGAAAGKLIDVLRIIPQNISTIVTITKVLASVKLAQWFAGLSGSVVNAVNSARLWSAANATMSTQTFSLKASMESLRVTTVGLGASLTSLVTGGVSAARGLTIAGTAAAGATGLMNVAATAARVLWVALGGWIGVIATGAALLATSLVGNWLSGVDETTSALDEHQRIMDKVLTQYDAVKDKTKDWSKILKDMTLDELVANARNLKTEFAKAKDAALDNPVKDQFAALYGEWTKTYNLAAKLRDQFDKNEISASDLVVKLREIYTTEQNDEARKYLEGLIKNAEKASALSKALDEATDAVNKKENALKGLNTTSDETKSALDAAAGAAKNSGTAFGDASEAAEKYKETLDGIKGMIPALANEMKKMKDQAKLDSYVKDLGMGPRTKEQQSLIDQAQQQINVSAIDLTPIQNTIDLTNAEFQKYYQSIKGKANLMSGSGGKYGDPQSTDWQNTNLTGIESATGRKALVNKASAAAFQGFLNELEAQGYNVESLGGFNYRNKRDGTTLSEHAYGNAIDINPTKNAFSKKLQTDLPSNISEIAAKYGLSWGGDWQNKKDAMHFEYTGTQAPGASTMSKEQLDMQKEATKELQKQTDEKKKQDDATQKTISDGAFELSQQDLKNAGKEREAAIEQAIREAKAKDPNISDKELETIRQQVGALYDKQKALSVEEQKKKSIADATNIVNELEQKRNGLLEQRKYYEDNGNALKVQETTAQLQGVNAELLKAIDNAIAMNEAMGGTKADLAIQKLNNTKLSIANANLEGKQFAMTAAEMGNSISSNLENGLVGVFDTFAQAIANGENGIKALGTAFRQFAANFLIEIGKMILKQVMFNALQAIGKSIGGSLFNFTSVGTAHTGGVIGATGVGVGSRSVSPGWFSGAVRYHTGGIAGLAPDEVPAVLKTGEEVLTETDPRHRNNGGGKGATNLKIINTLDPAEVMEASLSSVAGEKAMVNWITRNSGKINGALDK